MSFTKFLNAKAGGGSSTKALSIKNLGSAAKGLFKTSEADNIPVDTSGFEPFIPHSNHTPSDRATSLSFPPVSSAATNSSVVATSSRVGHDINRESSRPSSTQRLHQSTASTSMPPQYASPATNPRQFQMTRDPLEEQVQYETHIAKQAKFVGALSLQSNSRIDGDVEGEIHCFGVLQLGAHANIKGNVYALQIECFGSVVGDLFAEKRLSLRSTAKVQGNLASPSLRIEDGATFDGGCFMRGAPTGAKSRRANTSETATEQQERTQQTKLRRDVAIKPTTRKPADNRDTRKLELDVDQRSLPPQLSHPQHSGTGISGHPNLQVIRGHLDSNSSQNHEQLSSSVSNNKRLDAIGLEPSERFPESSRVSISRAQQKRVEQF